jgi:hypothetical protein
VCVPQGTEGSNPSLSAIFKINVDINQRVKLIYMALPPHTVPRNIIVPVNFVGFGHRDLFVYVPVSFSILLFVPKFNKPNLDLSVK